MQKQSGFTLLEILVVIALIALASTIIVGNMGDVIRTTSESFARQAATLIRSARDHALLSGKLVRIRFDLDEQTYWVEDGKASNLLLSEEEERALKEKLDQKEWKAHERAQGFRLVRDLNEKKQVVPNGLRIDRIVSPRYKEPFEKGIVDIYFWPHGFSEAAVIQLRDSQNIERSLVIHPITGKTKIEFGKYNPREKS